jgi:hypothetical protein
VYQDVENKFHLLTRDFHRMLFPKIQWCSCISC